MPGKGKGMDEEGEEGRLGEGRKVIPACAPGVTHKCDKTNIQTNIHHCSKSRALLRFATKILHISCKTKLTRLPAK